MAFTLDQVVPWGRNLQEYQEIFALSAQHVREPILDVAGGPASFNAEMTAKDAEVTSLDIIYQFSADDIRARIRKTAQKVGEQLRNNQSQYVWDYFGTVENVIATRLAAMELFLADYEKGKAENRYQFGSLPQLPFAQHFFGLALCSHFLFSYTAFHDYPFHINSITEMLRVAREVRIFPVTQIDGQPSAYLGKTIEAVRANGFEAEILRVNYEFQKGSSQMLVLRQKQ